MTILRAALISMRALTVLVLLAMSAGSTLSPAYAAPDPTAYSKKPQSPKKGPAPVSHESSGSYLDDLLDEINARRAMVGTQPVVYIAAEANEAVGAYLADLTPQLEATMGCYHGDTPAWDYVAAVGVGGEARGEVLACPDDGGFWTSDRIADAWLNSPGHFDEIYGDADANAVACGTYGAQRGGRAFETIACVTYRI